MDNPRRLGRGRCSGCDKVRVLYYYEKTHGTPGFLGSWTRVERYCSECLSAAVASENAAQNEKRPEGGQ